LAGLTLIFGMLLFDRSSLSDRPTAAEIGQVVLGVILVIILFNRVLPFVIFTRTRGTWIVRWRWFLKLMIYPVLPITFFLGFLLSIAALAEAPAGKDEEATSEA